MFNNEKWLLNFIEVNYLLFESLNIICILLLVHFGLNCRILFEAREVELINFIEINYFLFEIFNFQEAYVTKNMKWSL